MKFNSQTYLLLLAAASSPAAFGQPVATTSQDGEGSFTRLDNGPPTTNPGANTTNATGDEKAVEAAPAPKCISFTSDNPNWYYANTGVWGTTTGTFASTGGKICVTPDSDAGGAMFIGTKANPQGGNTKLECFFPTSGTANCDMSLVDGYSLSVTCTAGSQTIGGATDLWKTGKACVDSSETGQGICKNDQGYAPAPGDVTPFFQQGTTGGNNYCIWKNCGQDYFFPVSTAISCHVSGGQ